METGFSRRRRDPDPKFTQVILVQNWFEELRAKVEAGQAK